MNESRLVRTLRGVLFAALVFSLSARIRAADPAVLRWGGDATGGGPYVIEKPDGSHAGFEVELADYLATAIGRKPQFVQANWADLPALLKRGEIDIVLNGYEWSPELERLYPSTVPYYIFRLRLIARKADPALRGWDDVPGKSVGVLKSSAAERYLEREFGGRITLRSFDTGVTDVMDLVQKQQELQATLQDVPAADYYLPGYPGLERVGEPVDPGYYVIYVRREDEPLLRQLNDALRKGLQGGKESAIGRIYAKWNLWNADQERLVEVANGPWPPTSSEEAPSRSDRLRYFLPELVGAAGVTVILSCLSMPLAMLVGLLVAVGRLYGPRWLSWLLTGYVEFLRGTPLLFQLYFIYFVLPEAGVRIASFWAGVLGLAINYSAYEAENYRAGLLAIPRGQMEAALSLGMSVKTALWRIIVPQAVRLVIPPVTNDFIALFKDTSVCSVIAVTELTGRYNRLYNNNRDMLLELALLTAVLYLLMSIPLSLVARRLERRFPKVVL